MKTSKIALGGVCAALSVILLAIGSVITTLDISLAFTASVFIYILMLEYDGKTAFSVFAVTSALSILLMPQKSPAVMYLLFFGWYPFAKRKLEQLKNLPAWILKIVIFNISLVLYALCAKYLLLLPFELNLVLFLTLLLANVFLILYDICCTRFIVFYVNRIAPRIHKITGKK